ncbi:MAG: hypothetical protein Q4F67_17585 [Propionibacteriaceae bacterium]|nr:hypothetical protein [Propionibacteriaceae bacterium]
MRQLHIDEATMGQTVRVGDITGIVESVDVKEVLITLVAVDGVHKFELPADTIIDVLKSAGESENDRGEAALFRESGHVDDESCDCDWCLAKWMGDFPD